LARIGIALRPDIGKWNREVNSLFVTFKKEIRQDISSEVDALRRSTPALVAAGLDRDQNPSRGHVGLTKAIQKSIYRKGDGITVGDPSILTANAIYWHVIEVGGEESGHFSKIGHVRLIGFGKKVNGQFQGPLTPPGKGEKQSDAVAGGSFGGVIKNAIRPHGYVKSLADAARTRMERDVKKRLDQVFS
jgi:hypothetical protein